MLLRECHEILVEIEACNAGGRVRRIADDQRDRLRDRMNDRSLDSLEELRRRLGRHRADDTASHQEPEGVDWIAGIGTEHDVARRGDCLRDVGKAFLRPKGRDDLGLRIELHPKPAGVVTGLGATQPVNPLRRRIAIGPRLAQGLLEFFDDVGRRRQVRIAHTEIDDIGPGVPRGGLGSIDLLEHVGRQTADAVKLFHELRLRGDDDGKPRPWGAGRFQRHKDT